VAAAVVRIEELERRVSDLERRADENRGQAQGA
jgi:hypothetical protein